MAARRRHRQHRQRQGAFFRVEQGAPFYVFASPDGFFLMERFARVLFVSANNISISGIYVPCCDDGKSFSTLDEIRLVAQLQGLAEDGSLANPFTLGISVVKPSKFEGTDEVTSPSTAANDNLKTTFERCYFHDFRPSRGLPIGIFVEAFAKFRDLLKGDVSDVDVGDHDLAFVQALIREMPKYHAEEKLRQDAFAEALSDYLKATTGDLFEVVSNTQPGPDKARPGVSVPDIEIYVKWAVTKTLIALIEVKNEVGFSGEPSVQNLFYYAKSVSSVVGQDVYYTGYPQLLMELVGPHFRVGGGIFQDKAVYEPLTPYIPLLNLHQHDHTLQLARLGIAIRKTLCQLRSLYQNAGSRPRELCCEHALHWPYRLQQLYPEACLEHFGLNRQVYFILRTSQPSLCVKFVQGHYGLDAHTQWAELGYAPTFTIEDLPDEWKMITMESFSEVDGWHRLTSLRKPGILQEWDAWKAAVLDAVAVLQAQRPRMVHGDMRGPNIMLNVNTRQVQFLDFDWAGPEGYARYPPFLNKEIVWPSGAKGNALITAAQDLELVSAELNRLSMVEEDGWDVLDFER